MNLPRNGTLLANLLLVTAGLVAGAGLMWVLHPARKELAVEPQKAGDAAVPDIRVKSDAARDSRALSLLEALKITDPRERSAALRALAREAAGQSLRAALAEADGIAGHQDRLDFTRGVIREWAGKDPAAAADYAKTHFPPGDLQNESVGAALAIWAPGSPRDAFLWIQSNLSGPQKEAGTVTLLQSWALQSPREAADWFLETGMTNQNLVTGLVSALVAADPGYAAGFVETTPPEIRDTARAGLISDIAAQDPVAAAPIVEDLIAKNDSPAVPDLAGVLADIWGTSDPAAAAAWIEKLPAGTARDEAAGVLAGVWGAADIHAAADWAVTLADDQARQAAVNHLGTTWGAIEPEAAIAWIGTLPSELQSEALHGALNSWAGTNADGLAGWIQTQPPSPATDYARRNLADVLAATDFPGALDQALAMQDPDLQATSVSRYYNAWTKRDAEIANEWLQASWTALPPLAQERLSAAPR